MQAESAGSVRQVHDPVLVGPDRGLQARPDARAWAASGPGATSRSTPRAPARGRSRRSTCPGPAAARCRARAAVSSSLARPAVTGWVCRRVDHLPQHPLGQRVVERAVAGGHRAHRLDQHVSGSASLSRKPEAPASRRRTGSRRCRTSSAPAPGSGRRTPGPHSARVAVMPSRPGIRMSMHTTSGRSALRQRRPPRRRRRPRPPPRCRARRPSSVVSPARTSGLVVGHHDTDHERSSSIGLPGQSTARPATRRRPSGPASSVAPVSSARSRIPTSPKPDPGPYRQVVPGRVADRQPYDVVARARSIDDLARPRRARAGPRWPATPAPSGTPPAGRAARRRASSGPSCRRARSGRRT